MNKLVALNVSSVCLLSLGYRSNRVITLGVSSVFLFAIGVYFVGSWRRPGAADVNWWWGAARKAACRGDGGSRARKDAAVSTAANVEAGPNHAAYSNQICRSK